MSSTETSRIVSQSPSCGRPSGRDDFRTRRVEAGGSGNRPQEQQLDFDRETSRVIVPDRSTVTTVGILG